MNSATIAHCNHICISNIFHGSKNPFKVKDAGNTKTVR